MKMKSKKVKLLLKTNIEKIINKIFENNHHPNIEQLLINKKTKK